MITSEKDTLSIAWRNDGNLLAYGNASYSGVFDIRKKNEIAEKLTSGNHNILYNFIITPTKYYTSKEKLQLGCSMGSQGRETNRNFNVRS